MLDGKMIIHSPASKEVEGDAAVRPLTLVPSASSVLLRGMKVRNTKKVWGVVIYTGHETKIMKNNEREVLLKVSMVDRMLNANLIIIMVMLSLFCVVCAIATGLWVSANIRGPANEGHWYVALNDGFSDSFKENWYGTTDPSTVGFLALFTFILLFANLVPISLYFTIELVKMSTGFMIGYDNHMYDPDKDLPAKCRNNNIIEEAGQIEYILSDKTGTLTQNKMELLKFSAGGKTYGQGTTEIEMARAKLQQVRKEAFVKPHIEGEAKDFAFYDETINRFAWLQNPDKEKIEKFLWAMAICHTTVPEQQDDGSVKMNAASPDDGALVKACFNLGIKFMKRKMKSGHIDELTFEVIKKAGPTPEECQWAEEKHNVLETIDFTSTRKRMSVIAQGPDGKITIYMKGADNYIRDRLKDNEFKDAKREKYGPVLEASNDLVNQYSADGLRTLFVASHDVPKAYFDDWHGKYRKALEDKDKELMNTLEEEIEHEMELIGVTAIEDKLQVNVGKCLTQMRNADIRTWVLTGDKVGTAIMIGFAAELLQENMHQIIVEERDADGQVRNEDDIMRHFADENRKVPPGEPSALIIDGAALLTLGVGLDSKQCAALAPMQMEKLLGMQRQFIEDAQHCAAVLCCRVSPAQKGHLTKLVRNILNKVTVGIGDGANDVGMILEAHVGIGVQGVEGSQAVNSADFAICQFQHLANVILVHGRWTYYRLCRAICYFFYKNIVNVFTIVWYALVTGFSGTLQYDDMVLCMYNLFFTSFPVIIYALLEQDVDYDSSIGAPQIYHPGQISALLNFNVFFMWVLEAIFAASVIFHIPYQAMGTTSEGIGDNLQMVGLTMYTINVWTVTLRLALETQFFTYLHGIFYIGSVALWYLFMAIEFAFPEGFGVTNGYMYWASYNLWGTTYHWLCLFIGIWISVLPAFTENCYNQCFKPSVNEATRRAVAKHKEEQEEALEKRRLAEENMSDAEKDRRARLTQNLSAAGFRDGDINPVHAMQGRSTKLEAKKNWALMKSTMKFKGLQGLVKKKPGTVSV
jgi:phospholipid-translocating P-type ATPase (flippase)